MGGAAGSLGGTKGNPIPQGAAQIGAGIGPSSVNSTTTADMMGNNRGTGENFLNTMQGLGMMRGLMQGNPIPQGVSGTSFSGPDPRFQRAQVAQPAPIAPAPQIANTPTVYQPNFAASGAATDYTLSPLQAQSSFMRNPTEAAPASLQQGIYNPYSVNSYMNPYGMYGGFNPYGGGIMGLLGGYGMGGMGGMGGYGMGGYGPYRFY